MTDDGHGARLAYIAARNHDSRTRPWGTDAQQAIDFLLADIEHLEAENARRGLRIREAVGAQRKAEAALRDAEIEHAKEKAGLRRIIGSRDAALRRAQGVDPQEIEEQRATGWPDFHPEDYCHRCGRSNIVWYAASPLWNEAVPEISPILCPQCFVAAWEAATSLRPAWALVPDPETLPEERRSDADSWLITQREVAEAVLRTTREALAELLDGQVHVQREGSHVCDVCGFRWPCDQYEARVVLGVPSLGDAPTREDGARTTPLPWVAPTTAQRGEGDGATSPAVRRCGKEYVGSGGGCLLHMGHLGPCYGPADCSPGMVLDTPQEAETTVVCPECNVHGDYADAYATAAGAPPAIFTCERCNGTGRVAPTPNVQHTGNETP